MHFEDKFKIKLNQNLWVLVAGFLSLGFSEYYDLEKLRFLSLVFSIFALISVVVTLLFYTI
ncbi:MAG: hypothetical protein COT39_00610 [Parcubacteria group bacterium CG08_land_8_20_14_0_20_48_21]|nr:MAG: hypothetical protein AUK21_03755 [Parcubacteria group bacterium CG2_30_48_51]PIS33163.1 MAG: hypothetical protein COT39_00610 [Parcubacteria group bacterium CG08_land_8_20_14_0_20_48_21]PIW79406.1 MAG: hypothetical protein COZ99_01135 [Parcubacteria group bacterium CG_4_8_14_3_um_filter_48_16]PIY77666.1 MAG: hypothetical protein COY83_03960 [Parcubacteria group bacterium CG_4_10_14_0_8_um_filter_48_154]PIZ77442.1 MAG: hypothetical protein COY03_02820 [bacterium CG_4_10_14_0_2_um_filter_